VELGNFKITTATYKPLTEGLSFWAEKKQLWFVFAGIILTVYISISPSPKSVASANPDTRMNSTAASYLAARQALHLRDYKSVCEFLSDRIKL